MTNTTALRWLSHPTHASPLRGWFWIQDALMRGPLYETTMRTRQKAMVDKARLNLSSDPDQIGEELQWAITRYVCVHNEDKCYKCFKLVQYLVKPMARAMLDAGLYKTRGQVEGYRAVGRALEAFIKASKERKKGEHLKIVRNMGRCLACETVIESKEGKVTCRCGAVWLSGGKRVLERGGDLDKFEDLSELQRETF